MNKINKRILVVEDTVSNMYVISSLKKKFDEVVVISDYLKPLHEVEGIISSYGRLPQTIYSEELSHNSPDKLVVKAIDKINYVKLKDLDLGEDNAYFVVGKLCWYYLRDFHPCHVGLRNTNLDWQVVHLKPFSMGSNKFVFCHSMTDEHYSEHIEYFFDDEKITKTVKPLKNYKILKTYDEIYKALIWGVNQKEGTRFGLDYESNGLWRGDKYEDLLIIGFSIATKDVGFYIEVRYLSDKELEDVKNLYKSFLDKHEQNIWVFNVDYELMATRKFLGPWSIYEFKDADVWRILYGDQIGYSKKVVENKRYGQLKHTIEKQVREQRWSLKYSAQKYLSIPSWDDEFEEIERSFNTIFLGYPLSTPDDLITNELLNPEWKKLFVSDFSDSKKFLTLIKRNGKVNKGVKLETLEEEINDFLPLSHDTDLSGLKSFYEANFEYKKDKSYTTLKEDISKEVESIISKSRKEITSFIKKLTLTSKKRKGMVWKDYLDLIPQNYRDKLDLKVFRDAFMGCDSVEEVYKHPEWSKLMDKYPENKEEFISLIEDPRLFGSPYAVQPSDIVGKYCILDSYYTVMIAEVNFEKDDFTPKGERKKEVAAKWVDTEKIVDVFNGNKVLGGLLNLYGLYKSNTKRDNYNNVQEKVRIFTNFILAKGYYKLLLHGSDISKHPDENKLSTVFKTCLKLDIPIYKKGELDFTSVSKTIFKSIYDPNQAFGWDEDKANKLLGEELAAQLQEILLDHKPSGFVNSSCHDRATNLHKECMGAIEEEWFSLGLGENFKWSDCQQYYIQSAHLREAEEKLECLDTFDIRGKTLEEVLSMNTFSYTCLGEKIELNREEMLDTLKKQFFDVATAKEVELGVFFEKWKDFKILFSMYNPKEFKDEIDNAGIFDLTDGVNLKVRKFRDYLRGLMSSYIQPKLFNWEEARSYAIDKQFEGLMDPDEDDMTDGLQATAFIDKVISADLFSKYKVTKKLMDTYTYYLSLTSEQLKDDKESLLKYSGVSPMVYSNWMLSKGVMCRTFDCIDINDYSSTRTEDRLRVCDIDWDVDYSYYPVLSQCFKLYRKYDKLGQYLNGQLVNDDHELISVDEDGVPKLGGLSKDQKMDSSKGDSVKMFPRYEIMQKFTKRNASGIHTVPSGSEVKGVIEAPEDEFLVYTDISSLELRGIGAISKDEVMLDYFDSGKDIYTEAAVAYHNDFLKKGMSYADIRKAYRNPYKLGVISSIYTASDPTLARSYGVEVFEVREITNAIFSKFKTLYGWQQDQLIWNKKNRGFIRTYMGDIVKTYDNANKQNRQAVNACVQGASSLIN